MKITGSDKQLLETIKGFGYKVSSDNMGIYLTGDVNKFSFIKTGDIYNCYYNKLIDGQYVLQENLYSQILLTPCLQWAYNIIRRDKK